jgi:hypothetical protein
MSKPGFHQRAGTLAQAKAECDLVDRWHDLERHERRSYWTTLTAREQDVLADTFGYSVARGVP